MKSSNERIFTIQTLLAAGDRVAAYWTGSLRRTGTFFGIAPTGRVVSYSGISLYRLENGKIAETRNVQDLASLIQQLSTTVTRNQADEEKGTS